MNKKNCDHCSKKDCEECVAEGGKSFCCRVCCDKYKRKAEETKRKKPVNVCRFC